MLIRWGEDIDTCECGRLLLKVVCAIKFILFCDCIINVLYFAKTIKLLMT